MLSLFLVALLIESCSSNDDSNIISDDSIGMGILSFEISPIENSLNLQANNLSKSADCSNSDIKFVRIAIKDSQGNCYYGNSNSGFHELEMDPLGWDSNNDETIDTWKTSENNKLLLPVGTYTLEYLAVTNNKGINSEIILMCPRKSVEDNIMLYQSLVISSLPLEFSLLDGEEHFLHLETLCFKREHAYEFGLVFISYEDPNPFYLCAL